MLLANMAVAHKIWRAFPEKAMLRRHPPPKEKSAQFLVRQSLECMCGYNVCVWCSTGPAL